MEEIVSFINARILTFVESYHFLLHGTLVVIVDTIPKQDKVIRAPFTLICTPVWPQMIRARVVLINAVIQYMFTSGTTHVVGLSVKHLPWLINLSGKVSLVTNIGGYRI